jgi:hypothetical protein
LIPLNNSTTKNKQTKKQLPRAYQDALVYKVAVVPDSFPLREATISPTPLRGSTAVQTLHHISHLGTQTLSIPHMQDVDPKICKYSPYVLSGVFKGGRPQNKNGDRGR